MQWHHFWPEQLCINIQKALPESSLSSSKNDIICLVYLERSKTSDKRTGWSEVSLCHFVSPEKCTVGKRCWICYLSFLLAMPNASLPSVQIFVNIAWLHCHDRQWQIGYLLSLALVRPLVLVVDATEVWHDDGDREGDHQHARQGTHAADNFAQHRVWHHVSIPATNMTSEFSGTAAMQLREEVMRECLWYSGQLGWSQMRFAVVAAVYRLVLRAARTNREPEMLAIHSHRYDGLQVG